MMITVQTNSDKHPTLTYDRRIMEMPESKLPLFVPGMVVPQGLTAIEVES